ncbi:MAG: flagellar biosynthesis protein FlhA [bacterium]
MAVAAEAMPRPQWMKNADVLVAIGIITIVIMMIIPVPPFLLDILLSLNIMVAVVVILTTIYLVKAIEFAVFPSLLLVATVYRLGLNVSTTRMILLGRGEEIGLIKAFGTFVVAGNYVVGVVIFLILVLIQFLVIVKGTTRVSEVAARFTLDAMPGKQMAIDADLNAGLITEKEAIARRQEIRREADFYGAMDGAAKFVQGDVIAGLIITVVNIAGGFIIGAWMLGMSIGDAARTFTLLTVGDGLVSQIPALLISVATGLIVTRAASESNLGEDLISQLMNRPRVLWITAGTLAFLAFTPLPTFPLLSLAIGAGAMAYLMGREARVGKEVLEKEKKKEEADRARKPESVISLLKPDPMELSIGYSLIPLVDPEQGGDLLERVTMIRRQCALDMGIVVPPIRIRDNMQLKPNVYSILIKGVEVAGGEIKVDHYLAMNPGTVTKELKGEETIEPAFGLPAIWITEGQREQAEMAGYTVVDPPSIVATHLTEVIKRNASQLLGRQETQELLNNIKESYPALVDELVPSVLPLGEVQKVLHNLLDEGISIRDLVTILETLADYASKTKDTDTLTEYVRMGLNRQICNRYKTPERTLPVITLDPKIEEMISQSIQETREGPQIVLKPAIIQQIIASLSGEIKKAAAIRYEVILLCSPQVRRHVREMTKRVAPNLIVLSYAEVSPDVEVEYIGMVKI